MQGHIAIIPALSAEAGLLQMGYILRPCLKKNGVAESWRDDYSLRALAVIPRDLGSVPSTHMAANNHL